MEFKDRIRELRKEKGITQQELADLFYVSRQAVTKWETGRSTPDIETIYKLADYFGVTANYLMNGDEVAIDDGIKVIPRKYKVWGLILGIVLILTFTLVGFKIYEADRKNNLNRLEIEEQMKPILVGEYINYDMPIAITSLDELKSADIPYLIKLNDEVDSKYFTYDSEYKDYIHFASQDRYSNAYIYSIEYIPYTKSLVFNEDFMKLEVESIYDERPNSLPVGLALFYKPIDYLKITSLDSQFVPIYTDYISYDNGKIHSSINGYLSDFKEYKVDSASRYNVELIGKASKSIAGISNTKEILVFLNGSNSSYKNQSHYVKFIL